MRLTCFGTNDPENMNLRYQGEKTSDGRASPASLYNISSTPHKVSTGYKHRLGIYDFNLHKNNRDNNWLNGHVSVPTVQPPTSRVGGTAQQTTRVVPTFFLALNRARGTPTTKLILLQARPSPATVDGHIWLPTPETVFSAAHLASSGKKEDILPSSRTDLKYKDM